MRLSLILCVRWLYMLIVAMDANFRLKSRLRTTLNREPTLGLGLSYFVDHGKYTDFVKNYVDQEEVGIFHRGSFNVHLICILDTLLCRLSSDTQHVDQEIEGTQGNGHGGRELCPSSDVPATWDGGLAEG